MARDSVGLSDTDIARALKVSNPTVNGWMTGKTVNIEARHLLPVCKLLGVSPFWIMYEDEAETDVALIPEATTISAMETIRLIALYAQATDDGRRRALELLGTVQKRSLT